MEELKKQYTILITEDEKVNRLLLKNMLLSLFKDIKINIFFAEDEQKYFDLLEKIDKIDVILMDYELGNVKGTELTKKTKEKEKFKYTPIIFVTGAYEEDVLKEAFKAGAIEFLHKPYNRQEFYSRLFNQMRMVKLIDDLERVANYDMLTNLYNRNKVLKESENIFFENDNVFAIMFDIDNFKKINDTYGHDMGDEVLKRIGKIVKESIGQHKNIVAGRYGGEEFLIVGSYKNKKDAKILAEKLREKIEKERIYTTDGKRVKITASFGVAFKEPDEFLLDDLLKKTDNVLYFAKGNGKNRVEVKE